MRLMPENDYQLTAVRAHSLLGTIAAAKGAIDTILTHNLDDSTRDSLLLMARRRLDRLADELRHLALGLPDPDDFFAESDASAAENLSAHRSEQNQ
jgi:hypothetical protein